VVMKSRMVKRDGKSVRQMYDPKSHCFCKSCESMLSKANGRILNGAGCIKCDPLSHFDRVDSDEDVDERCVKRELAMLLEHEDGPDTVEADDVYKSDKPVKSEFTRMEKMRVAA